MQFGPLQEGLDLGPEGRHILCEDVGVSVF